MKDCGTGTSGRAALSHLFYRNSQGNPNIELAENAKNGFVMSAGRP